MSIRALATLAVSAGAAIGGAALANAAVAASAPKLENWFEIEPQSFVWRGHRVAHWSMGSGRPVLFVHGVHAAASSFEWTRNISHFAASHRVHAIDLLGFGKSDRPEIAYDGALYSRLVSDFLREVVVEPAAVVASSLSAVFAADAACSAPERVSHLVLVNPTSGRRVIRAWAPLETVVEGSLDLPVVGQSLFNVLVSEPSIRSFLKDQVVADHASVDDRLIAHMYATSHQPGARFAPAAFINGRLDGNLDSSLARVRAPLSVIFGSNTRLTPALDPEHLARVAPGVRIEMIENTRLLPHYEQPDRFHSTLVKLFGE